MSENETLGRGHVIGHVYRLGVKTWLYNATRGNKVGNTDCGDKNSSLLCWFAKLTPR